MRSLILRGSDRTITLSRDGAVFTVVDVDTYDYIFNLGPWCLYDWGGKLYARRTRRRGEKGPSTIYMHRVVALRFLGPPPSRVHLFVDHKDGNGLNNRQDNLRWATPKQNRWNILGQMQMELPV